jgi:hypothetical protein
MPEMHDPLHSEQVEQEEQEEHEMAAGLGGRTRDAMFRMLGGVLRLPKTAAKQAFDKTLSVMNPEVATHLIQSNRELLLAVRSFVDYEIRMADRAIQKVQKHNAPDEDATASKPREEKHAPPPPDPLL